MEPSDGRDGAICPRASRGTEDESNDFWMHRHGASEYYDEFGRTLVLITREGRNG